MTYVLFSYYVLLTAFSNKRYQMLQKNDKVNIAQLVISGAKSRI